MRKKEQRYNKIKSNDNLNEPIHFVILFMGHALTFTLLSVFYFFFFISVALQQTVESTQTARFVLKKLKKKKTRHTK